MWVGVLQARVVTGRGRTLWYIHHWTGAQQTEYVNPKPKWAPRARRGPCAVALCPELALLRVGGPPLASLHLASSWWASAGPSLVSLSMGGLSLRRPVPVDAL